MKSSLILLLLLLAACGERPEAFTPVAVDMPVPVMCKAPSVVKPPDLLAALPKNAALAEGVKTCLRQTLLDRGYEAELEAALRVCR